MSSRRKVPSPAQYLMMKLSPSQIEQHKIKMELVNSKFWRRGKNKKLVSKIKNALAGPEDWMELKHETLTRGLILRKPYLAYFSDFKTDTSQY